MPLLKNGFLEKNETWYVGLSCQYTHFMSFSSKSEHDTVADQATLSIQKQEKLKNTIKMLVDPLKISIRPSISRVTNQNGQYLF